MQILFSHSLQYWMLKNEIRNYCEFIHLVFFLLYLFSITNNLELGTSSNHDALYVAGAELVSAIIHFTRVNPVTQAVAHCVWNAMNTVTLQIVSSAYRCTQS